MNAARSACAGMAAAVLVFYLAAFFPGALTFDGAYQWWQARGGETTNIHPPLLTWLWRGADAFACAPLAMFVLQLVLFCSGLALIASTLPLRAAGRATFIALVALAPISLVVFSAILSDALLAGVLCCALGLALLPGRGGVRFALIVLVLTLAVLLRKNALPAVLPLLVLAAMRTLQWRFLRSVLVAALGLVVMQTCSVLLDRSVEHRVTVLAATALWDLAAISIDSGELLLPAASHGPGLDIEDLRQAFVAYSSATVFAQTRAGVVQPFLGVDDALNGEIRTAWIDAVRKHPRAWLAHRWRLTQALFGRKAADWPHELVYFDGQYQYRDNPAQLPHESVLNGWFIGTFEAWRCSIVFAAWPYLGVALMALLRAWRRRDSPHGQAALAVLASGLLYALPLPLLAPSAELRYLAWTCISALIGAGLLAVRGEPRKTDATLTKIFAPAH